MAVIVAGLTVAQWSGVAGAITAVSAVVIIATLAVMWRKVDQLTQDTGKLTETVDKLVERVGTEGPLKADG